MKPEYALYKGDDLLYIGTLDEIAEKHGTKRSTIVFYGSPTHKKRQPNGLALIKIDLENEDE